MAHKRSPQAFDWWVEVEHLLFDPLAERYDDIAERLYYLTCSPLEGLRESNPELWELLNRHSHYSAFHTDQDVQTEN